MTCSSTERLMHHVVVFELCVNHNHQYQDATRAVKLGFPCLRGLRKISPSRALGQVRELKSSKPSIISNFLSIVSNFVTCLPCPAM